MNYVVIFNETLDRPNTIEGISGSISWNFAPQVKFFALNKTAGFDTNVSAKPTPFKINYHFISTDNKSFARKEQKFFDSDSGGSVAAYNVEVAADLFREFTGRARLYVSYNRKSGAQDVRVPLNIQENLSRDDAIAFNKCISAIIERAQTE